MELHPYASVKLSSRVGGGMLLRLDMSEGYAAPLHFATELFGGGYLIFERVSEPGVGVGAVYEAVRAVGDHDPDLDLVEFNPVPYWGGSSAGNAADEPAGLRITPQALKRAAESIQSLFSVPDTDPRPDEQRSGNQ